MSIRVKAGTYISANSFLAICKEFDVILDSFLIFALGRKPPINYQYKFNINYNMGNVIEAGSLHGLNQIFGVDCV